LLLLLLLLLRLLVRTGGDSGLRHQLLLE